MLQFFFILETRGHSALPVPDIYASGHFIPASVDIMDLYSICVCIDAHKNSNAPGKAVVTVFRKTSPDKWQDRKSIDVPNNRKHKATAPFVRTDTLVVILMDWGTVWGARSGCKLVRCLVVNIILNYVRGIRLSLYTFTSNDVLLLSACVRCRLC